MAPRGNPTGQTVSRALTAEGCCAAQRGAVKCAHHIDDASAVYGARSRTEQPGDGHSFPEIGQAPCAGMAGMAASSVDFDN